MNGDEDIQFPVTSTTTLRGIQGEPEDQQEPEGVPVRLEYYGRNFGENNKDANFGPDGTELQDHHVAVSPDTARQLGLNLHDWVWVGPQLRQYSDYSYHSPGRPNSGVVEVRDFPADGRTTLRKASDEEVAAFAPSTQAAGRPSAMQAAYFTGKEPTGITAQDVNQIIQGVPQRALIAGEAPAAAYEYAQAAEQPTYMQPAEEPSAMDVAASGVGMDGMVGGGGTSADVISGDFAVPNPAHSKVTSIEPDGTKVFDNGAMKYHPNTDTLEWNVAGRTFVKTGEYGKVQSFPSAKIVRNPDTGEYYNMASGVPTKVQIPGQSPAYDDSLSTVDNLKRLSPEDAAMVQMYATYQAPLMTRFGRLNPVFQRLSRYVQAANPHLDPRNYQIQQQTMTEMASDRTGSPGQRVKSWNQALIHGGNLWDLSQKLPEGKLPAGNTVANWINTNLGGAQQKEFESQAHFFANEVERAITGGVPSVTEVDKLEKLLSAAGSKAQIEGVLRDVMAKTIEGGLERANFGYKANMGVDYPTNKLIAQEAADSLAKFGISKFAGRDVSSLQSTPIDPMQQKAIGAINAWNASHPGQQKELSPDNIKRTMAILQQPQ